jgi:hypothetical protein
MSEHTPKRRLHHALDPAADDVTQTDLVAGDPPVPITVWRTARTSADTGHRIGARLAARLIAAYSRPREAVVDLTDGHDLTDVCTTGGRRYHPAWLTDTTSMIIGPATRIPAPPINTDGDTEDELPEVGAWFGNDLTDPHLPPTDRPVVDLPADTSLHQATSLIVACWPLDTRDAANRIRLAWLLTGCARMLRPGGCLILVAFPNDVLAAPENFTPVVQAAARAGLGYLQHIVAVEADTDGDAFVYHVTDEELLTLSSTSGRPWPMTHLRVHADLLVFSRSAKQQTAEHRRSRDDHG